MNFKDIKLILFYKKGKVKKQFKDEDENFQK